MAYVHLDNCSFELFYADEQVIYDWNQNVLAIDELYETNYYEEDKYEIGWYYQFGFPGYMPDSVPYGPFNTEEEAYNDAVEFADVR